MYLHRIKVQLLQFYILRQNELTLVYHIQSEPLWSQFNSYVKWHLRIKRTKSIDCCLVFTHFFHSLFRVFPKEADKLIDYLRKKEFLNIFFSDFRLFRRFWTRWHRCWGRRWCWPSYRTWPWRLSRRPERLSGRGWKKPLETGEPCSSRSKSWRKSSVRSEGDSHCLKK